ncbi:MAG TPA: nucleotide exchange factor GrpE [Burkholderiales bacterium]|nr:nucleotide exchange factor GrpE [Burkholderiales bacterium]
MQETPDYTNSSPEAEREPLAHETGGDLEHRLKQAELAAQEHHDAWLRAKAEADNVRKRSQTEIANAHKFAVENFASELTAVKDSLEAALASETATAENMRNGVELTLKQLKSVFEKFNVKEIDPAGEKFDPHRHQALSTAESDAEPNTVVQVLQKGYLLHDRVIRPALVIVSKPKAVEN